MKTAALPTLNQLMEKTWEEACDYHPDANNLDDVVRLLSENK
ncbi:hypothetical protein [Moorena bouillonii]|nr:hypothetical protein [Moorena bouillonii]